MNPLAWTYLVYLGLTTGLTVWVARTLRRSGTVLIAGSDKPDPLTDALAHLLVIGFYLVNFGIISYLMKSEAQVVDAQRSIELLSAKVGAILVVLGGMHFLLLLMFLSGRKQREQAEAELHRRETLSELRFAQTAARSHSEGH